MPGKGALSSFSFCLNRWSDSAPAFSLVQQDVRQQRRQRPAPRRPSVVGATRPASMTPASRLSPHQHQHPLVRQLARQPLHQHVVVHPVEELDFEPLSPLIQRGCLLCGSWSSRHRLVSGCLQIPLRGGHPCLHRSPCRTAWREPTPGVQKKTFRPQ